MRFPRDAVEFLIDPVILKRGLDYHKKGLVGKLVVRPDLVTAEVAGTEPYAVNLHLKGGLLSDAVCSCPYVGGPVCKHIVAVLYALQNGVIEPKSADPSPPSRPKSPARTKPRSRIPGEPPSRKVVASQVKHVLRSVARGRPKFIAWDQTRYVAGGIEPLLTNAELWMEAGHHEAVMNVSMAVMTELMPAFDYTDDSNGDLSDCISAAIDMLKHVSNADLSDPDRHTLLDFCVTSVRKKRFDGWDWHLDLLHIAAQAVRTPAEAKLVMTELGTAAKSVYSRDRAQLIRLSVIRKMEGDTAAESFIESHLGNPLLREEAIRIALKHGNHDRAFTLAEDGIRQDTAGHPSNLEKWVEWKLKTAVDLPDPVAIVHVGRDLYLRRNRHDPELYALLNRHLPHSEWSAFTEGLIRDLSARRYVQADWIAAIHVTESRYDRLLDLLRESPDLRGIIPYHAHLAGRYPAELAALYRIALTTFLDREKNRNAYREAARILRLMKKLGQRDLVAETIADFRLRYANRPALMQELDIV